VENAEPLSLSKIKMASRYSDPKDFVLHVRCELLSQYLKKHHGLNFQPISGTETREECADRFIEFINTQTEELRDKVFMELEYINTLSSENHINALCSASPHINRKEIEDKCENYDERALFAFTLFANEFDNYYSQANVEELGVKELTLPKTLPMSDIEDEKKILEFEKKVQSVYLKSFKGERCKIKHFRDHRNLILRAYLEDLPTRDTAFERNKLNERHVRKPVFDVVFVYKPELKVLGVRALGGKKIVSDLQKLFCEHFLGIKNIDTEKERYSLKRLGDLKSFNLIPNASYGVERAYLKSIRLHHKGNYHKIFVRVGGQGNYSGTDALQQILVDLGIDKSVSWEAESIQITVVFKQAGHGRRKQVTVTITPPNTCDLKNRPQDDVVRKLLNDWGIYVA